MLGYSTLGVRKGSWTEEEDALLRQCIQKHGEGNWHLIPCRAGINRCRKSCRLRWLNYLSPNIKRGQFTPDEVDLILRLHKLLGNRWSLIAGRLPGRTPNDVKNYWNTHICKRSSQSCPHKSPSKMIINRGSTNIDQTTSAAATNYPIVRPLPTTFSKSSPWIRSRRHFNQGQELLHHHKCDTEQAAATEPESVEADVGGGLTGYRSEEEYSLWDTLLEGIIDDQLYKDRSANGNSGVEDTRLSTGANDQVVPCGDDAPSIVPRDYWHDLLNDVSPLEQYFGAYY